MMREERNRAVLLLLALAAAALLSPRRADAQGGVAAERVRPFVVGFAPAAGSGAVGGVSVDPQGVVRLAKNDAAGDLRQARLTALRIDSTDIAQSSPLRKISLRRLEAAIAEHRRLGQPLPDEMQVLAGLQEVRYVFAYPEQHDVVLAGRAEGWRVDDVGNHLGATTARPVLQLADLLAALRSANAGTSSIRCSIDPTSEGIGRLQQLMRQPGFGMNQASMRKAELAVGPHSIRISGVDSSSRFARVMVSADYLMKRLAMGLETPPVDRLPSYLELVRREKQRLAKNSQPRWWMTPQYDAVSKSPDGLAWELRGSRVEAHSASGQFTSVGLTAENKTNPVAQQWAQNFTTNYPALAAKMPVFAELQNLMDLAVVAALLTQEDLPGRCDCPLSLMLNSFDVHLASYPAPRHVESHASFVIKGNEWILAVSGGVEINPWGFLRDAKQESHLPAVREKSSPTDPLRWWWD